MKQTCYVCAKPWFFDVTSISGLWHHGRVCVQCWKAHVLGAKIKPKVWP